MNFAHATSTQLLKALSSGETSSVALLEFYLERIDRLDGDLNAIVALDRPGAMARAHEADQARARGESWGVLHGLPMTIKDAFEVVGMPTTSGAPELANHQCDRNADAVERLLAAGAIVFGKTNLPLYAGDFQSYNAVYGTTSNPFDPTRGPGGSSGGAAAALAAGFTPLELGSDIGGSIRNPSHFCGVFGHKPSYGIVPIRGHIPGPPGALVDADLGVAGPLARSAEDLTLALDVLTAPSQSVTQAWSISLPKARHDRLADYRVAAWLHQEGRPVGRAVTAALEATVAKISQCGAHVDAKARPAFDVEAGHRRYQRLLFSVLGSGFPPEALAAFDAALSETGTSAESPEADSIGSQMVRGVSGSHRDWLADNEARAHVRVAWENFFHDFDVVVCPIWPTPAFPHDQSPFEARELDIDGQTVSYAEQIFWAGIATVAYLPATVAPMGLTDEGLPVGVQIIGPYLEDRTPLRFAELLEQELGGFVPPPMFGG